MKEPIDDLPQPDFWQRNMRGKDVAVWGKAKMIEYAGKYSAAKLEEHEMTIKNWQERYTRGDTPNTEGRIDLMQDEIDELRAELAKLKQQEPVSELGEYGWEFMDHLDPETIEAWNIGTKLYLAAGAQP